MRTCMYVVVASFLLLATNTSSLAEDPPKSGKWEVEVFKSPKTTPNQTFSFYMGTEDGRMRAVDFAWPTLGTLNGLGIDVAPAEEPLRAQLKLPEKAGLVVTAVPEGSIGAKAGINVHDVLIGVGGKAVGNAETLTELLAAAAAQGTPVKLHLVRGGENVVTEATPKKPEVAQLELGLKLDADNFVLGGQKKAKIDGQHYRLGVTLAEADTTLRAQLGLATGEGLVVTDVVPESAAADAGVKSHDVLTVLDGTRLTTVDAINAQIQEIKDREVELKLVRGGKERSLQLAPRKSDGSARTDDVHNGLNVNNCQSCHANAWQNALLTWDHDAVWKPHQFHGGGQQFHLWSRKLVPVGAATQSEEPQQQLATLKEQLAAMQQTLTKLEAALQPQEPAKEEQEPAKEEKEKKKD